MNSSSLPSQPNGKRQFATTRWSLVANAAGEHGSGAARDALAELCQAYWYPLYAFVRRRGNDPHAAEDLTQEFFLQLLDRQSLRTADRERGHFRTFLLTSLSNFLANQARGERALKRGGNRKHLPIDLAGAERRYLAEPATAETPERAFQRRWAMTILQRCLARLEAESLAGGKRKLFENLRGRLGGDGDGDSYRELAEQLGMTESAVKVAAHRLRLRCRELLREEIAQTVSDPAAVDDELQHLFQVVSS